MHDPEFCRIVFNNNSQGGKLHTSEKSNGNLATEPGPKLGLFYNSSKLIDLLLPLIYFEVGMLPHTSCDVNFLGEFLRKKHYLDGYMGGGSVTKFPVKFGCV